MNPAKGPRRDETQTCLLALPPEMLCRIVEYLKEDPRDILNLSMTCTKLRDLLQKEDDLAACRLEESIPLLLKWLEKEDILNCREICKRVRKAVDKALDHIELISPLENLGLFPRLIPPKAEKGRQESWEWRHLSIFRETLINELTMDSVEDLEQLRRDVEERKISTVVTKSLNLCLPWTADEDPPTMDPPDFLDRAVELLNCDVLRRNLVQICLFDPLHDDTDDPRIRYEILRRLMGALPNLRCVVCDCFPHLNGEEENAGADLARFIGDGRPLPALALERLVIGQYSLMAAFLREIARTTCGTLRELDVILWGGVSEAEVAQWQDEDYHFPALLKLLVWNVTLDWVPILGRIHADNLKLLRWSVKIDSRPSPVSPVTLVVRTVQQFPNLSCMTLRFEYEGDEMAAGDHSAALEELRTERHVNLKQLEVENYWRAIPLQFLVELFPNLEFVSVKRASRRVVPRDSEDVLLDLRGRLEESALWSLLPKLIDFSFETSNCTRAEAEAFQNQRV